MRRFLAISMLLSAVALPATAQDGDLHTFQRFFLMGQGGAEASLMAQSGPPEPVADVTYKFISSEMNVDSKVVKGAPYSAEASTETVQVLADGNRITHKNTATLYRDSQGRTRREETLSMIGPWTVSGGPPVTVFINDPVAGTSYILDPASHTAHKMPLPNTAALDKGALAYMGAVIGGAPAPPDMPPGAVFIQAAVPAQQAPQPQSESLGTQTISGVNAQGTRTTVTIPAGQIGNEQPISIITERWYSPDLMVVVMSKHTDPRVGTTTYQLNNISRTEPMASLFEVPSDYTLQDTPGPVRILRAPKQ